VGEKGENGISNLEKRKKTDLRSEGNVNTKMDMFECQTPGGSKKPCRISTKVENKRRKKGCPISKYVEKLGPKVKKKRGHPH